MKKQARLMQEQFGQMQSQLKNTLFEGSAGNGLVTLTLSGEKAIKKISIKRECINPSDIEGLQDLIIAAFEDAAKKVDNSEKGLPQIPGFGF